MPSKARTNALPFLCTINLKDIDTIAVGEAGTVAVGRTNDKRLFLVVSKGHRSSKVLKALFTLKFVDELEFFTPIVPLVQFCFSLVGRVAVSRR